MVSKSKGENKEEFIWKFIVPDISPIFKEINSGIFKKIIEPDVYTCDEEHNDLAQQYISEGIIQVYTKADEPLKVPSKRYAIEDGRFMVYESKAHIDNGEMIWKEHGRAITDNFYIVIDEDVEFDDGIEKIHKYRGRIIVNNGANEFKFNVDSRLFATPQEMAKILSNIGGAKVVFDNRNLMDIRNATQLTSEYESRKESQVFGWHDKIYQSQSSIIFRGIIKDGDSNVDLSDIAHARHLDLKCISDKEFNVVGKNIVENLMNMHERYPIDCLLGFTFLAPIASRITDSEDWSGGNIGLWMSGSSGCGKSYTSLLFQNFFGDFKNGRACLAWTSTPYSIQEDGYYYKDAICMVDDFKMSNVAKNFDAAKGILQNYTDGTARTRLNINSIKRISEGRPIRGSLLITGEDLLDDVNSIMARYHIVEMSKEYINRSAGKNAYKYRKFYSGFMGRYIAWLLTEPNHVEKIVGRIEKLKDEFIGDRTSANIDRISQSFAYNLVGFETFCRFMRKSEFISGKKMTEMVKTHKNNLLFHIDRNVVDANAATISEIFLNTLADLINSGEGVIEHIAKDKKNQIKYPPNQKFIGFDIEDEFIYFYPLVWNIAGRAISGFQNARSNLTGELIKRGLLIPGKDQVASSKKLRGHVARVWKIYRDAVGYCGPNDFSDDAVLNDEDMNNW